LRKIKHARAIDKEKSPLPSANQDKVTFFFFQDDAQYIDGFRICMDKTFKLINCNVTKPERCRGEPVKYPVIRHSQTLF
jgi:ribonuclease I